MDGSKKTPANIDAYISGFPKEVQPLLETMRQTVKKAIPQAEEAITYGMPTFRLRGKSFFHFAAFKKHIGVYPIPYTADPALEARMLVYQGTKSALHFPLNQPLPVDLITEIAKARVEQVLNE